jgi:hypothetical protein
VTIRDPYQCVGLWPRDSIKGGLKVGELQRIKEKLGVTDSITVVFHAEKDGRIRAASTL